MIHRRLMLLAAPLCVVVVAASVAFAATPDTEHSGDAKLDKLHQERPIAASFAGDVAAAALALHHPLLLATVLPGLDPAVVAFEAGLEQAAERDAFDAAMADAAARDAFEAALALAAAPPPAPEATAAPEWTGSNGATSSAVSSSSGGSSSGGGSSDALSCIRAHESDSAGGYQAVSSGGTYRGAYQFLPSTWNTVAASSGRPDLVGVDPASASAADQDAMASSLYASAGSQPWGGRC
jgi:hypothetical protein